MIIEGKDKQLCNHAKYAVKNRSDMSDINKQLMTRQLERIYIQSGEEIPEALADVLFKLIEYRLGQDDFYYPTDSKHIQTMIQIFMGISEKLILEETLIAWFGDRWEYVLDNTYVDKHTIVQKVMIEKNFV